MASVASNMPADVACVFGRFDEELLREMQVNGVVSLPIDQEIVLFGSFSPEDTLFWQFARPDRHRLQLPVVERVDSAPTGNAPGHVATRQEQANGGTISQSPMPRVNLEMLRDVHLMSRPGDRRHMESRAHKRLGTAGLPHIVPASDHIRYAYPPLYQVYPHGAMQNGYGHQLPCSAALHASGVPGGWEQPVHAVASHHHHAAAGGGRPTARIASVVHAHTHHSGPGGEGTPSKALTRPAGRPGGVQGSVEVGGAVATQALQTATATQQATSPSTSSPPPSPQTESPQQPASTSPAIESAGPLPRPTTPEPAAAAQVRPAPESAGHTEDWHSKDGQRRGGLEQETHAATPEGGPGEGKGWGAGGTTAARKGPGGNAARGPPSPDTPGGAIASQSDAGPRRSPEPAGHTPLAHGPQPTAAPAASREDAAKGRGTPSIPQSPLPSSPIAQAPPEAPVGSPATTTATAAAAVAHTATPAAPATARRVWRQLFVQQEPGHPTGPPARSSVESKGDDRQPIGDEHHPVAELLHHYKVKDHFKAVAYRPRGLVNTGNMCYVHSILQTLLGCRPVASLLRGISELQNLPRPGEMVALLDTPVMDCLTQFISEIRTTAADDKEVAVDKALKPTMVYKVIESFWQGGKPLGRQEDAQEFLTLLLDHLHEDCLKLMKAAQPDNGPAAANDDDSDSSAGWVEVLPKNKTTMARHTRIPNSPISAIFNASMRSTLRIPNKEPSAAIEPYTSLPLDIQSPNVEDLTQALGHLFNKETIDGFKCSSTKRALQASKEASLDGLPPILILHMKRFVYDMATGAILKVHKTIRYHLTLEIDQAGFLSSMAQKRTEQTTRTYQLFAVVYHHGNDAYGGHYTCDVLMPRQNAWLRYDDADVREVTAADVTKLSEGRDAYILLYQRADLVK